MLSVNSVFYDIDGVPILEDVSFSIPSGEKVGLVGSNGSGKSTLLKLIASELRPTRGSIQQIGGGSIGYLPQIPRIDECVTAFDMLARGSEAWFQARTTMSAAVEEMSAMSEPTDGVLQRYAEATDSFESAGGWAVKARIQAIQGGLGLGSIPDDQPFIQLS